MLAQAEFLSKVKLPFITSAEFQRCDESLEPQFSFGGLAQVP
jgi:hypothetical protein